MRPSLNGRGRIAGLAWALIAVALAAPGMASAKSKAEPNPIDQATRDSIYIRDISIAWAVTEKPGEVDAVYAAEKDRMISLLVRAIGDQFKYSPTGSDAASLKVTITAYKRYQVVGNVEVVRQADAKVLGDYRDIEGIYLGRVDGGGLSGALIGMASVPDSQPGAANCFATKLRARFTDIRKPVCS